MSLNYFTIALLCLISLSVASEAQTQHNMRPIFGILTQPYKSDDSPHSYIAASYVKYIESAGARVIPIFHNESFSSLDHIFKQINGIIFPGGGSDLSPNRPLFKAGQHLYNLALQANDRGIHFPIFGHCMGFQFLSLITSDNPDMLEREEADDVGLHLNFTNLANRSRMFREAPADVFKTLATEPVTMNYHHWGVSLNRWVSNQRLNSFYDILSTNVDIHGSTFVSTVEGKRYPIYGYQWHPEKNSFEWTGAIIHTPSAIRAMQYMADFTVGEGRKNMQRFESTTEEFKTLIYNYSPTYTAATSTSFVQSYIF